MINWPFFYEYANRIKSLTFDRTLSEFYWLAWRPLTTYHSEKVQSKHIDTKTIFEFVYCLGAKIDLQLGFKLAVVITFPYFVCDMQLVIISKCYLMMKSCTNHLNVSLFALSVRFNWVRMPNDIIVACSAFNRTIVDYA